MVLLSCILVVGALFLIFRNQIKEFVIGLTGRIEKPVIYLYPEEETEISVKLGDPEKLIVSYPKYTEGWKVNAKPDGELIDIDSSKVLYALYYESQAQEPFEVCGDGYVIQGTDVEIISFLEEKLTLLGLNDKEREEFIIYWLPVLMENDYDYIRFATYEEIEAKMPIEVYPIPDTTIRVLMTYKGLDAPISVIEQNLEAVERNGYTMVEWGGSEIR